MDTELDNKYSLSLSLLLSTHRTHFTQPSFNDRSYRGPEDKKGSPLRNIKKQQDKKREDQHEKENDCHRKRGEVLFLFRRTDRLLFVWHFKSQSVMSFLWHSYKPMQVYFMQRKKESSNHIFDAWQERRRRGGYFASLNSYLQFNIPFLSFYFLTSLLFICLAFPSSWQSFDRDSMTDVTLETQHTYLTGRQKLLKQSGIEWRKKWDCLPHSLSFYTSLWWWCAYEWEAGDC